MKQVASLEADQANFVGMRAGAEPRIMHINKV